MKDSQAVVVIVSNGPGELATWVKPVAERLVNKNSKINLKSINQIDLRLVLVPCPNANGNEADVAKSWNIFSQIIEAKNFWSLLLNPKRYGEWSKKGLVVFLGGDQFWTVLLSRRLKYKHFTYAEWVVRWPYWNDRIAAMSPIIKNKLSKKDKNKCIIVGDLMADINNFSSIDHPLPNGDWVALLPGSKKAKLCIGVPFFIEVADLIKKSLPDINFILPIAPTIDFKDIQKYSGKQNPIAKQYKSEITMFVETEDKPNWGKFITSEGTEIYATKSYPSYSYTSQCKLALTTVGANTAELGALTIPMIVIVPTQHLIVMEAWDGLLGILGRLPGLKWCVGKLLSAWRLRKNKFLSWPNISAGRIIVPEKVGKIYPSEITKEVLSWLKSPERLKGQREDLQALRGKPGAVEKVSNEIIKLIE